MKIKDGLSKFHAEREFTTTGAVGGTASVPYIVSAENQLRVVVENAHATMELTVYARIRGQTAYTVLEIVTGPGPFTLDISLVDEIYFDCTVYAASGGTPRLVASGFFKRADTGGGVASEAPKLIATFNTSVGTAVGDLLKVTGPSMVDTIPDNSHAEIPNGIFGVAFDKPTATTVDVIFIGALGGYSSLTTGAAIFVDLDGTPTHTVPLTGMVQQIGFAISTTEIFFSFQQAMRRS